MKPLPTRSLRILSIDPTLFFVRCGDALRQLVRVTVENEGHALPASLKVQADGLEDTLALGMIGPGTVSCQVYFPDIPKPVPLRAELWAGCHSERSEGSQGGTLRDARSLTWQPQKHWEVYLVHYAHHDLGYTDLPGNVLQEYNGFMDQVLRYCQETADWPDEDARFRYQCEQAWSAIHYIEHRPPDVVERLVRSIQNGQIEVTALFGNQTLELCSAEELVRLLYPSFGLKRRYGIAISSAEHNDIPGFPWGLASVLAGAGVRYFSPGVPLWYFDGVHPLWDTEEALPLGVPAACWWEGPDGARVLLWSDLHGQEWQPYNYQQAVSELPAMLRTLEEQGYPYDMVSYTLRGGHRDNAPPTVRYAYMVREWNRRWAYPRLINTTNTPFLRAFEERWGDTLKVLRGDVPGTDYPVAATCTPKETAVDRNTHEWLMAAEKLAALAATLSGDVILSEAKNLRYEYPRATLDQAYRETFYYDLHCWGMAHVGGPAQDAHWSEKGGRAYRAAALAHDVMVKAANAIADQIAYPASQGGDASQGEDAPPGEDALYVTLFNALSHERTDVVRIPMRAWDPCTSPMYWRQPGREGEWPALVSGRAIGRRIVDPPAWLLEQPFELVDMSTGARVPYQVSTLADPQAARHWAPERVALGKVDPRHLSEIVFVAGGLPAMGYKTYQVIPGGRGPDLTGFPKPVRSAEGDLVVENRFYRLALDAQSGAVHSLFDKELGRELVDRGAAHGLGHLIVRASETAEQEALCVTEVSMAEAGPLYTTVRLKGQASCCPRVTVEITLYHALQRIDLCARILRDSTPMRELYIAFPFHVASPRFHFEASGAVIEPLRDQWPGSNTDCYAVQHWVDVGGDGWGVVWTPLDTPMAEFGGLWPGYVSGAHHGVAGPGYGHPFLRPGELERGHIYALVSLNNFRTNFINAHPGEFVVRYAFGTHRGDWREGRAWAFGWNAANPPLAVWMRGPQRGGGSLPLSASFCQVDAPNVVLLTFKRAEDGNGYVLRLIETAGQETGVAVTLPHMSILHAFETNLVEENQRLLSCAGHTVRAIIKPFAIATMRVAAEL